MISFELGGLTDEERRRLGELIQTRGSREHVVLKLVAAMAADDCEVGARWLVKKLLVQRARRGGPM